MPTSSGSDRFVYEVSWLVFIGSLLLTGWAYLINPIINPDGARYILAAEAFSRGDFRIGFAAYKWPFYSLTLAFFSSVTTLSAETVAYLFNGCMRGVAGIAFIQLVKMFGADRRHIILAAIVYVGYPGLNEVQSMIIRDFAYLACFMWMVVFLLRQMANPSGRRFAGVLSMGVLATAYRIEGLVFVAGLLVMYLVLGTVSRQRKRIGLTLIVIFLPLLIYTELMWLYNGDIGNAWGTLTNMIGTMKRDVGTYIASLEPGWWPTLLGKLSYVILFFMPFVKMITNTLTVLTAGYVLILIAGWFVRPLVDEGRAQIRLILKGWRWVIGINLLILIGFVMIKQIVTDRYPLSLSIMFMLFVPFAVVKLLEWAEQHSARTHLVVKVVLTTLLLLNTIEGLDRFGTKGHLREAGQWIQARDDGRNIYVNSRIIDYYSGKKEVEEDHYYKWRTVSALTDTTRWRRLSLMGISLPRNHDPRTLDYLKGVTGRAPDATFRGRKGDVVFLYDFRDTVKE